MPADARANWLVCSHLIPKSSLPVHCLLCLCRPMEYAWIVWCQIRVGVIGWTELIAELICDTVLNG